MSDALWAGPDLKLEYATFYFFEMVRVLDRLDLSDHEVTMSMITGNVRPNQQRDVFAHFDALISAARSIPEIIECCFGKDRGIGIGKVAAMDKWWQALPTDEQQRRERFSKELA